MKLSIISGSQRRQSQSGRVARYLARQLSKHPELTVHSLLDLGREPLPLWREDLVGEDAAVVASTAADLRSADGFIIVTPEWHGMATPATKNFFLLFGYAELAHKPALLVSVSAGTGGAYPIAELRLSSYKNSRICYLPDHVIVRHAAQVLHDEPGDNDAEEDARIRARLDHSLSVLAAYCRAFQQIRADPAVVENPYPNGM